MGFTFRKSIGVGPFRVNLSKSGVGYSVGTRGIRTGVSARGRKYTSFGIPGTGIGYRTSKGPADAIPHLARATGDLVGKRGCAGMIILIAGIGLAIGASAWVAVTRIV